MNKHDKLELVQRIKRAWAGVAYPGDDSIFTPDSYDDEGITEYFRGTTWEGHSTQKLRARASALGVFSTPAAYHYWLPAYLIAAVEDPDELSQGINRLVSSLAPEDGSSWFNTEQRERHRLLTREQKFAIVTVLEYLAWMYGPEEDIAIALEYFYGLTAGV